VHLVATQFGHSHHPRSSKATNSHLLSAHGKGVELQESQTGFSLYRFIALSLYRFIALSLYRFIALSLYRFIALSLYRLIEPSAPESQSFRNLISIGFNNATRLTLCHITMLNAIHLEGQPSLHKEPIDRSKLEVGVLVKGDKHLHLESRPLDRPQKIVYP